MRYFLAAAFAWGIATLWIKDLWPWAIFQALILGAAAVFFARSIRKDLNLTPWLALPFAVSVWGIAQLAAGWTESPWHTRASAIEWVTHGCAAVLAYAAFRHASSRRSALRVLVVAAGILALASTLQNYTAPGRVWWVWESGYSDMVFGPFVYHTKLANFAELIIPAAVWLAITERSHRILYAVSAIALSGAVVASASRGGMVVLLAEFAILSIIAGHSRLRATLAFATGIAAGAAIFGWEIAAQRWTADPLADLRLPIVRSGLDMTAAFWPHGAGLGTWRSVQPSFAGFDLHIAINQAHSDWVQWLAEGGIVWAAIMAAMFWTALRSARREWWTLGILFVWLHGIIDYPMQQTPALASLVVALWGASLTVKAANTVKSPTLPA